MTSRRPLEEALADIEDAAAAVAELVRRGKDTWEGDRLLRLAGEAVVGRIADAANRLPDEFKEAMAEVPWDDIRDMRIVVDHVYHRIDYEVLWETLTRDVPELVDRIRAWRDQA